MKNSFWGLIWFSFKEIQGFLIGFLGVLISVLLVRFPFKTPIPLDLVLITGFFILLILFTLIKATDKAFNEYQNLKSNYQNLEESYQNLEESYQKLKKNQVPKILQVRRDKSTNLIVCIFENSDLFATELRITFYYTDDYGFESAIAVGFIETIQSNGKILSMIDYPNPTYQDIIDRLAHNDSNILEKTIVRPGVIKDFYQP